MCQRKDCGNQLVPRQGKYCSATCKHLAKVGGMPPVIPYKPEYANKKLKEYFKECERKNEQTFLPVKSGYIVVNNAQVPSKEGYADFLDFDTERVFEYWSTIHPEFAAAMDRLMSRQRLWLINYGLAGRYNPVYGKLMLGVNHGMVERKEVDNTHKMIGVVKHIYEKADEVDAARKIDNA